MYLRMVISTSEFCWVYAERADSKKQVEKPSRKENRKQHSRKAVNQMKKQVKEAQTNEVMACGKDYALTPVSVGASSTGPGSLKVDEKESIAHRSAFVAMHIWTKI